MSGLTGAIDVKKGIGLAKWLVKHAIPFALAGLESLYTDGIATVDDTDDASWRRLTFRFARETPVGTVEDYAIWGLDVINMTADAIDSSWTDADFTTVNAAVDELWTGLRPLTSSNHTLVDVQYHVRAFNPTVPWGQPVPFMVVDPITGKSERINPFMRSGPPVHTHIVNQPGTNQPSGAPYQAAMSVTFRTAGPAHWGRVYLAGLGATLTPGTMGRFASSSTQGVANLFAEFISDLSANDFIVKVTSTQHEKKYAAAHQAISQVVVDDIPDVIRRRRPKQAAIRSIGTATP